MNPLSCHCLLLIEVLLEAAEHLTDLLRPAKISHGIGNRAVIFEPKEGCQFP